MPVRRSGFTLIELLIVIAVIAILAAIAIPNMLTSRQSANETAGVAGLRTINTAEAQYRSRNKVYGAMSDLAAATLIDPSVAAATSSSNPKSGYVFSVTPSATNPNVSYYALALPAGVQATQQYYTDETAVIYVAPSSASTPASDTAGVAPNSSFTVIGG